MKIKKLLPAKAWIAVSAVVLVAAVAVPTTLLLVLGGDAKEKLEKHSEESSQAAKKPSDKTSEATTANQTSDPVDTQPAAEPQTPAYPVQLTPDQAASLTVVVNKKYKLPSTYVPHFVPFPNGQNLRPEAAAAMTNLFNAASAAGYPLRAYSSYRSYSNQESTYNGWVNGYGQSQADTFSARPGHSEHQTGLAADVGMAGDTTYDLEQSFGSTPTGQWLAAHAHEYGFIIRYPNGKDSITGYHYEPWHLRYLDVETATAVYNSGKTLEEYYGVIGGNY